MASLLVKPTRVLGIVLLTLPLAVPVVMPAVAEAKRGEPRELGSGQERGALVVKFRTGVSDAAATALAGRAGASEIGRLEEITARVMRVTGRDRARVLRQLAADPAVLSVEEDGEAQAQAQLLPNDPLWSKQWFARKVRGPAAWDVTTGAGGPTCQRADGAAAGGAAAAVALRSGAGCARTSTRSSCAWLKAAGPTAGSGSNGATDALTDALRWSPLRAGAPCPG
ncbi:hypothetical protein BH23CHL7_BH23CHL7_14800 [soil metagenome]